MCEGGKGEMVDGMEEGSAHRKIRESTNAEYLLYHINNTYSSVCLSEVDLDKLNNNF